MDLKKLKKEKKNLELELTRYISKRIYQFHEDTGVWPDDCSVYMMPVQAVGNEDYPDMIIYATTSIEV